VYAAGREHVTHVWVNGEARVIDARLQPAAFAGLEKRAQLWQNALKGRVDS
jgi:5-methylthioadenosine/S-adenosylhomocysteine deaminase